MEQEFVISAWAACAPGLSAPHEWREWAERPCLPAGLAAPDLQAMPALHRRRLGPLGRMAAKVAYECHGDVPDMPVIFASRYGDAVRSLGALGEHGRGNPVSPTDFALAVHNAIGAVVSIARGDRANYTSIAAGRASAGAGVVEAQALLHDGAAQVLLVCYDAPLPPEYAVYDDEAAAAYAWAWRIRRPLPGERRLRVAMSSDSTPSGAEDTGLPFGLDLLRFSLRDQPVLHRVCDGVAWTWSWHD